MLAGWPYWIEQGHMDALINPFRRRLDDITVGRRHRRDLGDVDALAASMGELGLLQPVVVDAAGRLLAGERRLAAARLLGWATIPVHVAAGLDDAVRALKAERDENTCRKPFAVSEAIALGRDLERLLAEEARRRQRSGKSVDGCAGGRGRKKNPGASCPGVSGKTRDQVGAAVGLGGRTFEKARAVVEAAERDCRRYGPLLAAMDRTGRVDGCYRRLLVLRQAEAIGREPPPLPRGPFRVVVVDPPWQYSHRPGDHSKRNVTPYPTMTPDEIRALPVGALAAHDAVLWLWATNAHLPDAFELVRAWGFKYQTLLTWVKDRIGTGDWLRGQTEHCLLAVRGRPVLTLAGQSTALYGPRRGHSAKPDEFYRLVESLCPGSKVELFARVRRPRWESHGAGPAPGESRPGQR